MLSEPCKVAPVSPRREGRKATAGTGGQGGGREQPPRVRGCRRARRARCAGLHRENLGSWGVWGEGGPQAGGGGASRACMPSAVEASGRGASRGAPRHVATLSWPVTRAGPRPHGPAAPVPTATTRTSPGFVGHSHQGREPGEDGAAPSGGSARGTHQATSGGSAVALCHPEPDTVLGTSVKERKQEGMDEPPSASPNGGTLRGALGRASALALQLDLLPSSGKSPQESPETAGVVSSGGGNRPRR